MIREFRLEEWRVQPQLHQLVSPSGIVRVEPRSMEVLVFLAEHAGKVVAREELIEGVWGEKFITEQVLTKAIWELRRALGDDPREPRFIQTIARRGYLLLAKVSWLESGVGETGRYRLLEKLGGGAMGEVFEAEDTRLRRKVALKFLPAEWSRNESARSRFMREARTASALDHPNICTVYDIDETEDGRLFIAMALYRGETLKAKLAKGPLPVAQAVGVTLQVAEGLAAAHDQGIVHRDIKPANVMITEEGVVKIVDFGLAKLAGSETKVTQTGSSVGTPAYMSPEQALGEKLDLRTDLFSLGVVLYETITGRLPFRGESAGAVCNEIINENPTPVLELNPELPKELGQILDRCLEKDPERRYPSARDLAADLKGLRRDRTSGESAAHPVALPGTRRRSWPWAAAGPLALLGAIGAIGAIGAWYLSTRAPGSSTGTMRFTPFTTDGGFKEAPRFSPDGEKVAYEWTGAAYDNWDIYVKELGIGAEPLRLTHHPAPDWQPVWSPDGRQIAFARVSKEGVAIFTVPSLGGRERKLTLIDLSGMPREVNPPLPVLSWSPDGEWLAFSEKPRRDEPFRIVRLSLATLEKRKVTSPLEGSGGDFYPSLSPDGGRLAFVRSEADFGAFGGVDVWVQRIGGGEARRVTSGLYGYIEGLSWSSDGDEIVFTAGEGQGQLWRVSLAGGDPQPILGVGPHGVASIWGDRMVYVEVTSSSMDVWRLPAGRRSLSERAPERLIASSRGDANPAYSPDGQRIAFQSERSGVPNIWVCDSDGSHPLQLTDFTRNAGTPRWSPDGRWIVFDSVDAGDWNLYVIDADGGIPRRLTPESSNENVGTWSRDGRWIYFSSDRSGSRQIWKMPAEGGRAVQVTRGGGHYAVESWDGRDLYYSKALSGSGIWRIPVEGGAETEVLPGPILWSEWALSRSRLGLYYTSTTEPTPAEEYTIQFLDLASGHVTELFRREGRFYHLWLAVSPDEEWILYGELPYATAELMLVENFR